MLYPIAVELGHNDSSYGVIVPDTNVDNIKSRVIVDFRL